MSKKALVGIQFNWVFIIIAGALILLFFVSIVTKQKTISDARISSAVLTDLEAILTGAKVSTGTVNVVTLPKTEIKFECDRYLVGRANMPAKDKVIFSPDLIEGRIMITWALDWNVPFWITNFLYLTSPEVRYIVVNDSSGDFAETIFSDWLPEEPKEINKEFVELGDTIEDKNNYRVKFVFVDQNPDDNMLVNLKGMTNEYVKAIKVVPDATTTNKGIITFYEKSGMVFPTWNEMGKAPYLKKESLIGAMFATDAEAYNCSMEKAFKKFSIISSVYWNRSVHLRDCYQSGQCSGSEKCENTYSSSISLLNNMKTYSFNKDDIDLIYTDINSPTGLEHQNGVLQLLSCVLIY